MPPNPSAAAEPRPVRNGIVLALLGLVVVAIVVVVLVTRLRAGSSLDLTGDWRAQQGPVTVELHLTGSAGHLTGTLATRNSPVAVDGTVVAEVHGDMADVTVQALGQSLTAKCAVSSSKMTCTGRGGNQTLTLTFIRP